MMRILLVAAVLAWAPVTAKDAPVKGYGVSVDARAVTGPPPAPGTAADAADRAAFARTAAGIGSAAWREGGRTLSFRSKDGMRAMSCALGRVVSPERTPVTARILARANADLAPAVNEVKGSFKRDRPFVGSVNQQTCDPRTRGAVAAGSGDVLGFSYPSGHAAHGAMAAQILTQIAPERAGPLKAWGKALGDNRVVCRVHWVSDVAAGRRLGEAVFAAMKSDAAYRADVSAARREMEAAQLAIAC